MQNSWNLRTSFIAYYYYYFFFQVLSMKIDENLLNRVIKHCFVVMAIRGSIVKRTWQESGIFN